MDIENIHEEQQFTWKDPYSTYKAILVLNEYGVPILASYGKEGDMRTREKEQRGFDPAVQMVMRNFADYDMAMFRKMKTYLRGEYCETAQRMQILSTIRRTF